MGDIGTSLATWRRLRELTMAETADRADVSISTLQRLEHGHGATVETLLRVARALGKSLRPTPGASWVRWL